MKIIGPSHVVRYKKAIECFQIPIIEDIEITGVGGLPNWAPLIKKELKSQENSLIIVADFRFGNKSINGAKLKYGIDKNLINHENDTILYNKSIEVLQKYVRKNVHLLFWDLAVREYENKLLGKYFPYNTYKHPVWNLIDCENQFSDFTISLIDLLKDDRIKILYIDKSNHLSLVGYIFFSLIIEKIKYKEQINTINVYNDSLEVFSKLKNTFTFSKSIVFGESILVRHLNYFLDRKLIDQTYTYNEIPLSGVKNFLLNNDSGNNFFVYVSSIAFDGNIKKFSNHILRLKRELNSIANKKIIIIFWKAYSQEVNALRGVGKINNQNLYIYSYEVLRDMFSEFKCDLPPTNTKEAESLVELNMSCQPTFKAILWSFYCSSLSFSDFNTQYKINFTELMYNYTNGSEAS